MLDLAHLFSWKHKWHVFKGWIALRKQPFSHHYLHNCFTCWKTAGKSVTHLEGCSGEDLSSPALYFHYIPDPQMVWTDITLLDIQVFQFAPAKTLLWYLSQIKPFCLVPGWTSNTDFQEEVFSAIAESENILQLL